MRAPSTTSLRRTDPGPLHRPGLTPKVARAILQTPKVYFFDTGLVRGDDGVRYENAVATVLRKHVDFLHDTPAA